MNHDDRPTAPEHVACALPSPRQRSEEDFNNPIRARLVLEDSDPRDDYWAVELTFKVRVQRMKERPGSALRARGIDTPEVALDEVLAYLSNESVASFCPDAPESDLGVNDLEANVGAAIVLPGGKLAIKAGEDALFTWCGNTSEERAEFTHQALAAINEVLPPTTSAKGGAA